MAKQLLVLEAQKRCFREAMESKDAEDDQRLSCLGAFFDPDGLIRLGGKLENFDGSEGLKHPIVLGNDHLTTLLIRDAHQNQVAHLRTDMVLACLRTEFWILQARRRVKNVLGKCIRCERYTAKPGESTQFPLPGPRTEMSGVFKNVGIDYLGPFEMKKGKVWVALFTCSATRGIHLETVEDLSGEAFLDALKRFVASVQEYIGIHRFSWSFNVLRAAWWGGRFKRLVRIVKDCMKKSLNNARLPLIRSMTVIKEIEAIINSRPLTVIPDNASLPEALIPAHFIHGHGSFCLPPGSVKAFGEANDRVTKLWRSREMLLNNFWKRGLNVYFLLLRSAYHKVKARQSPLAIGHIVLIFEPNLSRAKWKLGRISGIIAGKDTVERCCKVRVESGELLRTFQHLYKLM